MNVEEEHLKIEQARYDLEKLKFDRSEEREARNYKLDKWTKLWAQVATFVPIMVVMFGFYANLESDRIKRVQVNVDAQNTLQREFIDRQLSDFYYPIEMRLEKDTAVWQLAGQLSTISRASTNAKFSQFIETSVLLPNHQEIIAIIAKNFGLIKNPGEHYDPANLIAAINHYQRHVAVYMTLRELGMYDLNPIQVCRGCDFPKEFPQLISARIADLEIQRNALAKVAMH